MTRNRVIGRDNQIPWRLPDDMKFFQKTTWGNVLVMGRKTYESIGRPLPGRETVVVSRRGIHFPGTRTVSSLDEITLESNEKDVFICGGASLYEEALPKCSDLFLTVINKDIAGDTYFPRFESLFVLYRCLRQEEHFQILHYQRMDLVQ